MADKVRNVEVHLSDDGVDSITKITAGEGEVETRAARAAVVLPNFSNNTGYLKFGNNANATIQAAIAPTFTGNNFTPSGNVAWPSGVPSFNGNALGTHTHQIPFAFQPGSIVELSSFGTGPTGNLNVVAAANTHGAAGSLSPELTDANSAGTPSGTIAWPAGNNNSNNVPIFTGISGQISGQVSATGEPQHLQLKPWFRL